MHSCPTRDLSPPRHWAGDPPSWIPFHVPITQTSFSHHRSTEPLPFPCHPTCRCRWLSRGLCGARGGEKPQCWAAGTPHAESGLPEDMLRTSPIMRAATPAVHFSVCKSHLQEQWGSARKQSQALPLSNQYCWISSRALGLFLASANRSSPKQLIPWHSLGASAYTKHFQWAVSIQPLLVWR